MCSNSVLHTLSWASRKSRRPVKSIGSAEVLAAGTAIDEVKILFKALSNMFNLDVSLAVVMDSKDFFDIISTCRNASDHSIRADVSVIRYELETQNVNRKVWVPVNCNLANPLTKLNSPLNQALELLLFSGKLPLDPTSSDSRSSNLSTRYFYVGSPCCLHVLRLVWFGSQKMETV
ncbi:hypothetical protein BWQ96_06766 [Gracilariopsis chorda]|uniref:Uncharacterized protein n=1 Tax=Gracilariopsis chorda TaxID=448386 RepID=A0A2V3IN27_9FLOR|nr:hypothetical protein BWQ96_06766 [Gracilariopsis chorda]|eukprot:PXF43473.1 hypothetical protein BWQ96_06766 [Gracilariopsis chorda]